MTKFLSTYVSTSRGECDPCGEPTVLQLVSSIDEAVALVKDLQLEEIYEGLCEEFDNDFDEADDNFESASEFYQMSGVFPGGEIGWVESGEEGVMLVVSSKHKLFKALQDVENWQEDDYKELVALIRSDFMA